MLVENVHLSYCSNIHPGETWEDHFEELEKNLPKVKHQLSPEQPMGVGLRLSNQAAIDLEKGQELDKFKAWLTDHNLYVYTMNGFPFGSFHHTRVKDHVHTPDWTHEARVTYTKRLFRLLAELLPEGIEGSISTSPLSYRHWFKSSGDYTGMRCSASLNMLSIVAYLAAMRKEKGLMMHLDIEPEPDGVLETGKEFIEWFENDLLTDGIQPLQEMLHCSAADAAAHICAHIRLCYDVCHFAVGYESHKEMLDELKKRNISVGKLQISAAIKATMSPDIHEREKIVSAFRNFNEPVYLHQVVARNNDGSLVRYPDLEPALADSSREDITEWRSHFHVPIFTGRFGELQSTQQDIEEVLALHASNHFTGHFEVETYTWEVLPKELQLDLVSSIVRELQWVKETMLQTKEQHA